MYDFTDFIVECYKEDENGECVLIEKSDVIRLTFLNSVTGDSKELSEDGFSLADNLFSSVKKCNELCEKVNEKVDDCFDNIETLESDNEKTKTYLSTPFNLKYETVKLFELDEEANSINIDFDAIDGEFMLDIYIPESTSNATVATIMIKLSNGYGFFEQNAIKITDGTEYFFFGNTSPYMHIFGYADFQPLPLILNNTYTGSFDSLNLKTIKLSDTFPAGTIIELYKKVAYKPYEQ